AGVSALRGFHATVDAAKHAQAHYLRTGNVAALDESVAAWERVLGDPRFAGLEVRVRRAALNDAAESRYLRFQARGNVADLDAVVDACQRAAALAPDGSPERATYLSNLGAALRARYGRTGNVADLDAAVDAHRGAVALIPDGSPHRAACLRA